MIHNHYFVLIVMSILCVFLIYKYLSSPNINSCNEKLKSKLIFFYDSSNNISVEIINNIWSNIKAKYINNGNIELVLIDIYGNKKYQPNKKIVPYIYFIDYDTNTIFDYPIDTILNYLNLDNFIVNSFSLIQSNK
jgi:hypothetical protein